MSATKVSKSPAAQGVAEKKRSYALDALRGYAILTMILSSYSGSGLPAWMHHAQVPPPDFKFNGNLPGITWVDLVFPFFIFSMGAAIPLSLTGRLNRGIPSWKIVLSAIGRWLTFLCFAVACTRTTYLAWDYNSIWGKVGFSVLSFVFVFAGLVRLPNSWNPWIKRGIRYGGWIGMILVLCFASNGGETLRSITQPIFGSSKGAYMQLMDNLNHIFNPNFKDDWIIWILASVSLIGAVSWLVTRESLLLRLGVLGIYMAFRLSSVVPGWVASVSAATHIEGMFDLGLGNYLHILIPGTIAGDLILNWMKSSGQSSQKQNWSSSKFMLMIVMMLGFIVLNVAGLFTRWVPGTVLISLVMVALGVKLFSNPSNSTEKLLKDFFGWGAFWLVLGLLFEPYEGGIKKDSATMSYYYVTAGLATFLLIAFTILIDVFKKQRWVQLLIDNGQNPMIAYIGRSTLVIPVLALAMYLLNLISRFDRFTTDAGKYMNDHPWVGFLQGLAYTLAIAVVVSIFSKKKIFWRT